MRRSAPDGCADFQLTEENIMLRKMIVALLGALLASTAMAENPQQNRMKECNTEAAGKALKGDERKAFMSECLSGKAAAAKALTPQQEKMKACNAEAATKALKGDERKKFMSGCLSGK